MGRHRAARRPRARLLPARPGRRGARPRRHRRRRAGRAAARSPRSWGWMLQLYALHSRGLVGHRRPRRPARVRRLDRARARRAARCCSTRCTRSRPCRRCSPRPTRRRAGGSRRRWPCASPTSTLYREADAATRGAGGRAARRTPSATASTTTGSGPRSGRRCELLWHAAGRPEPIGVPDDLWQFAIFCALAERYGGRWSRWPEGLRHPAAPDVDRLRIELAPRVAFHAWLQAAGATTSSPTCAASRQEVGVRVVHDLAVGCDPEGADALGAAGRPRAGRARRRSAGRLQPAGPGLGPAAVAPEPARRDRLRRLPRPAARPAPAGRRAADRPRRRAVAAVVGAAGRVARAAAPTSTTTPRSCSPCSRWRRGTRARW